MDIKERYLFTPWEEELIKQVKMTKESITLISPFIKLSIIKRILVSISKNHTPAIKIVTRFTKQVFSQGSSDLSFVDLLINHFSNKLDVNVYKLSNLHAKIYIFDNERMFITSSNLTHSGLNRNFEVAVRILEPSEIEEVLLNTSHLFSNKKLVNPLDLIEMSKELKKTVAVSFNTIETQDVFEDPIDGPLPSLQGAILDSDADERGANKTILEEINTDTVEEINTFLRNRGDSSFNKIGDSSFESINRPKLLREQLTEDEIENKTLYWNELAKKDSNKILNYLSEKFGGILSNDENKIEQLKVAFIHKSWKNVYQYEEINNTREEIFREIGIKFQYFFVAEALISRKLFSEETINEFSINTVHIVNNYPYKTILSEIDCHFLLNLGDLKGYVADHIFWVLIGSLITCMTFDRFYKFYSRYFNRVDEFINEDYSHLSYKTVLQEICQTKKITPKYTLIDESGEDHRKTFEVSVSFGGKKIETGRGKSKKKAEFDAAYKAIKAITKSGEFDIYESKKIVQKKYEITDERIKELKELLSNLPFSIYNIRLFDVALTHPSYLNENPEKRSYRKLSFLGSQLDNLLKTLNLVGQFQINDFDKKTLKIIRQPMGISPVKKFSEWFDKFKLDKYLLFVKDSDLSSKVKCDIVQAIISVVYIDQGFEESIKVSKMIWGNILKDTLNRTDGDFVSEVQRLVQNKIRSDLSSLLRYKVLDIKKMPNNRVKYIISCIIDGKEYGTGEGNTKKIAKRSAAKKVLENSSFVKVFGEQ